MRPSEEKLQNIPVIDLGDILLRAVEYGDYKDMYLYGSDDEVTKTLFWNSYKNLEEAKQSVMKVFLSRPSNSLPAAYAIFHKEDQKMIGTCDILKVNWEEKYGEIGYVINRDYWNRGYMTKVCQAVMNVGFSYFDLNRIDIGHEVGNHGSRRVIEKCGFSFVEETYNEKHEVYLKMYNMYREDFENGGAS